MCVRDLLMLCYWSDRPRVLPENGNRMLGVQSGLAACILLPVSNGSNDNGWSDDCEHHLKHEVDCSRHSGEQLVGRCANIEAHSIVCRIAKDAAATVDTGGK